MKEKEKGPKRVAQEEGEGDVEWNEKGKLRG